MTFFDLFLYNCKEKAGKKKRSQKAFNSDFFKSNFNEHFLHDNGNSFPLKL